MGSVGGLCAVGGASVGTQNRTRRLRYLSKLEGERNATRRFWVCTGSVRLLLITRPSAPGVLFEKAVRATLTDGAQMMLTREYIMDFSCMKGAIKKKPFAR